LYKYTKLIFSDFQRYFEKWKMADKEKPEWYGDENELRKRYEVLITRIAVGEKLTEEEEEELDHIFELLSSDH
jgi:hypothetical protein